MSFSDAFNRAGIVRIAIIDDDLSDTITNKDIALTSDEGAVDVFEDRNDPDTASFIDYLRDNGVPCESGGQLISALNEQAHRDNAPARFQTMHGFAMRQRLAARSLVTPICELLSIANIGDATVTRYTHPGEVPDVAEFDLIIVDYFLVDSAKDSTIRLIEKLLDVHKGNQLPLLFILMSSHEEELSNDFATLRPKLGATGSRFRILRKPDDNADEVRLHQWRHTLRQLAVERALVKPIEAFISAWSESVSKATESIRNNLWELDAHALNALSLTAQADHVSFDEYFAELIANRILAEAEEHAYPYKETVALADSLLQHTNDSVAISAGAEIRSSRSALREILEDVSWHRAKHWKTDSKYPSAEGQEQQYQWFRKSIRFGTLIKCAETNRIWIHLTQSCDLAHVKLEDVSTNHLLLFPGEFSAVERQQDQSEKKAFSASYSQDSQWKNITWHLRQPWTPSICEFLAKLGGFEVAGQLRQEHAQAIVTKFASLSARVATPRLPAFGILNVCVLTKNGAAHNFSRVFEGHLFVHEKQRTIHFSASDAIALVAELNAGNDKNGLCDKLTEGLFLKKDTVELISGRRVLKLKLVPVPPDLAANAVQDSRFAAQVDGDLSQHREIVIAWIE